MKTQTPVMTYAEMEAAYDGEWVLVGEPDLTPMNEIVRGVVLAHDEDRVTVYEALWQLQREGREPNHVAVWYFGEVSDDVEILI